MSQPLNPTENTVTGTVIGPVVQAHEIHGGIRFAVKADSDLVVPQQLRPPPAVLVDRSDQQRALDELLIRVQNLGSGTTIAHLRGRAGMGSSALAASWLDRHKGQFPDGQLYADLTRTPTEPARTVLGHWLRALGLPPRRIPRDLGPRVAEFRTQLASRRMAIMLDNANVATTEVTSLIPHSAHSLVLVTSRVEHPDLAVAGARFVRVDRLDQTAALDLVTAIAGPARPSADRETLVELVELCDGHPLILSVVAAMAATRPDLPFPELAERFRRNRMTPEGPLSVASTLDTTYADLDLIAKQAYQALGLHPHAPVAPSALAAALNVPVVVATEVMADLDAASLIDRAESGTGWVMSELVHEHANTTQGLREPGPTRELMDERFSDYYLAAVRLANNLIMPARSSVPSHVDEKTLSLPSFGSDREASQWIDQNWETLLTFQRRTETAHPAIAMQYVGALAVGRILNKREAETLPVIERLLNHLSSQPTVNPGDLLQLGKAATREAIRLGYYKRALAYAETTEQVGWAVEDRRAIASALASRGMVYQRQGEFGRAVKAYREQLTILREIAESSGTAGPRDLKRSIALCLINLSVVENEIGKPDDAEGHAAQAIVLLTSLRGGDRYNVARARIALVAARMTAGLDESLTERVRAFAQARLANTVFSDLGAAHEQERALRVLAALVEPLAGQLLAVADHQHKLVVHAGVTNERNTDVAERIENVLSNASSKVANSRDQPQRARE